MKSMKGIILELLVYFIAIGCCIVLLRMMIISIQYDGKYYGDFNVIGELWFEIVGMSIILLFLIIMTIWRIIHES